MNDDRAAVDDDLAAVGVIKAVKNRHQGRLSGTVLAHDTMHRAARNGQIDIPVGANRSEALVDLFQLDRKRGVSGRNRPLNIFGVRVHWTLPLRDDESDRAGLVFAIIVNDDFARDDLGGDVVNHGAHLIGDELGVVVVKCRADAIFGKT